MMIEDILTLIVISVGWLLLFIFKVMLENAGKPKKEEMYAFEPSAPELHLLISEFEVEEPKQEPSAPKLREEDTTDGNLITPPEPENSFDIDHQFHCQTNFIIILV